jgi:hypothetical protein
VAAIDRDDTEHVARKPHSQRCSALNRDGTPCGAWSLRGQDACYRHSMTEEEWAALAAKGGTARAGKGS